MIPVPRAVAPDTWRRTYDTRLFYVRRTYDA